MQETVHVTPPLVWPHMQPIAMQSWQISGGATQNCIENLAHKNNAVFFRNKRYGKCINPTQDF